MSGYPQLLWREEPSPPWPATHELVFVYECSQETSKVLLQWKCHCSVVRQPVSLLRHANQTAWSNVFIFFFWWLSRCAAVKLGPKYYWQAAGQIPCEDLCRHHPVIYRQNSLPVSGSSPGIIVQAGAEFSRAKQERRCCNPSCNRREDDGPDGLFTAGFHIYSSASSGGHPSVPRSPQCLPWRMTVPPGCGTWTHRAEWGDKAVGDDVNHAAEWPSELITGHDHRIIALSTALRKAGGEFPAGRRANISGAGVRPKMSKRLSVPGSCCDATSWCWMKGPVIACHADGS